MKQGSLNWNPDLKTEADSLLEKISAHPEKTFAAAVDSEAFLRAQAFLNGVKAYHSHPYQRSLKDPKTIWQEGNSRLLDYGGSNDGPVMLAVPSLINKAYILDLNAKRSFMRTMAKKGIRSFLLDWGTPDQDEKNFNLEDYVMGRLKTAVDEIVALTGKKVTLVGYCMGGVLCSALCALEPDNIERMALLATPWDFHAGHGTHTRVIKASRLQLEGVITLLGELPIDVIQALFAAIDPYRILQKFADFAAYQADTSKAEKFVAMEDWLNDGVPLAGPVARECLFDWYVDNKPALGLWEMDGHIIDPTEITCPCLVYIPQNDRIVPPESASALAQKLPNAQAKYLSAGHIGMVTGRDALKSLYNPLAKWLLKQDK